MNEFNVLVEGSADKPILEGAFGIFYKNASRKILVNGSVAETREGFLVRFYHRAGLPFAVYVDADSGGRELSKALKRWGIEDNKIVCADELFPDGKGNDFELEDLISVELYHRAVGETYPNYQVAPPNQDVGKRTKHYEKVFKESHGIGFNKRRVAERLKKLLLEGNADEKTGDSLKKVADAIWDALQKQVGRTGS